MLTRTNAGLHVSQRCVRALKLEETGAKRDPKTGKQTLLPRGQPALTAYLCPAKVWTAGWGSTRGVTAKTVWTPEQCDAAFGRDIMDAEASVRALIGGAPTTQGQFDAFVSFVFNAGATALGTSTLMRKHLAGDLAGAAAEFPRWNKGTVDGRKVVMPGLIDRRALERSWYQEPAA